MIPKIIHNCWIGPNSMPKIYQEIIHRNQETLPDYEFKFWGNNDFDIDSIPYVKQAYDARKYAFVSDYIRLYVLQKYGGIYLDVDISVRKPFDELFEYDFFAGIDLARGVFRKWGIKQLNSQFLPRRKNTMIDGLAVCNGVIGYDKNSKFLDDLLLEYRNLNFDSSKLYLFEETGPNILARYLCRFGFRYVNKMQLLCSNVIVLPSEYFPIYAIDESSKSFICHEGEDSCSWYNLNEEHWLNKIHRNIRRIRKCL